MNTVLSKEELNRLNKYFRTANYLAACQLYLMDNPLLKEPLKIEHIKPNVVGHWGTVPGQNFIYTHLNRIIKKYDLNMFYITGPGHGGNSPVSNTYIEGSYTKIYPEITQDEAGLKKLFKQFSFPGGVSSHAAPETPGSINEGGELGYSLSHAFGAVLNNPNLIAACVVGDGEAETGPLAASWQLNKILNPVTDGTVLPILHLNGYKIANPSVFARIPKKELLSYFKGCGWEPIMVEGSDPLKMHELMAAALDKCIEKIKAIKNSGSEERPTWPMLILKTPKGWTGPKFVDGKMVENSFRAHQVPIVVTKENPEHLKELEQWLRSYKPEELFDKQGIILKEITDCAPPLKKTMGLNPNTNGGLLIKELKLPDFKNYRVEFNNPGEVICQDMSILGDFVSDIVKMNKNFRVFGPDELLSNRLNSVFNNTKRQWLGEIKPTDEFLCPHGQVIDSVLSEHLCEGMLEGYLLTGRHGFFHCYEAFIRIVDSMVSQHAKWLKVCSQLAWRADIASLNIVLSSHAWQQDHNGFTHQSPGFLDHLATNKPSIVRMYLPPDANCLLSCFDHVIKSKNCINVIVASKHPRPQWLTISQACEHCEKGIGIWDFACTCKNNEEPDIVLACAGDTPTLETLAAAKILKQNFPTLKIRVVNVVDLMRLTSHQHHPYGLTDEDYDALFTNSRPIIFAFHGYPNLIHQLTYKRHNQNLHVRGYIEEGTITTPFDMRVQNKIDRFNLVIAALTNLPQLKEKGTALIKECQNKLTQHKKYIDEFGQDLDEIRNWKW